MNLFSLGYGQSFLTEFGFGLSCPKSMIDRVAKELAKLLVGPSHATTMPKGSM